MKTITINTSRHYPIHIGSGLFSDLGKYVASLGTVKKVCIVSETNVWPLYGDNAEKTLRQTDFEVTSFVFPAGEESKNAETYLALVNFLAESKFTRSDILIALGGGVVGDLTGFAAATFLRGIRFIQIPTTLLAAVDSSVGGKTAIDLPAGKNLCGTFWQPSLVLCDTNLLSSLPEDIFRDGCAEVIKYSILYDSHLFSYLKQTGLAFDREAVISRCIELKRDVVSEDEFDTGARMKLNLGHTVGHGIEARSQFDLSHGKSVAIGMAIIARSAAKYGFWDSDSCNELLSVLTQFELPISTDYPLEDIYSYTLSDKKRTGGSVNLIIPRRIGHCDIVPTPISDLKTFIQAGL